MPIRSGAMQRPSGCRYSNMLRQRYDEVGLPCSNTMGSPSPTSTYAISLPRTCRRFFWYGNAAEIIASFRYSAPSVLTTERIAQHCWAGLHLRHVDLSNLLVRGDVLRLDEILPRERIMPEGPNGWK